MATWTVQPGDTLTGLARTLLGCSTRWRELQLYNWALLTDPEALTPGMILRLPPDARRAAKGLRVAARSGR